MKKLLTRAVTRRPWEDDSISPAKSVAQILHYRVTAEAERKHPSVMAQPRTVPQSKPDFRRTPRGISSPHPTSVAGDASRTSQQRAGQPPEPMPVTPFDGKLKELLGAQRWNQDDNATTQPNDAETASGRGDTASLPDDVAGLLSNSTAPTGSGPKNPSRADPANETPPPARRYGCSSDGRDSR